MKNRFIILWAIIGALGITIVVLIGIIIRGTLLSEATNSHVFYVSAKNSQANGAQQMNGAGTIKNPYWGSLDKIINQIPSNSIVYLDAGIYYCRGNTLGAPPVAFPLTPARNVKIVGAGMDKTILSLVGWTTNNVNEDGVILITNNNVTVEDLTINGNDDSSHHGKINGILDDGGDNCEIRNVHAEYCGGTNSSEGFIISIGTGGYVSNCVVEGCRIDNAVGNYCDGINFDGSGFIDHNFVSLSPAQGPGCINSGGTNIIISGNILHGGTCGIYDDTPPISNMMINGNQIINSKYPVKLWPAAGVKEVLIQNNQIAANPNVSVGWGGWITVNHGMSILVQNNYLDTVGNAPTPHVYQYSLLDFEDSTNVLVKDNTMPITLWCDFRGATPGTFVGNVDLQGRPWYQAAFWPGGDGFPYNYQNRPLNPPDNLSLMQGCELDLKFDRIRNSGIVGVQVLDDSYQTNCIAQLVDASHAVIGQDGIYGNQCLDFLGSNACIVKFFPYMPYGTNSAFTVGLWLNPVTATNKACLIAHQLDGWPGTGANNTNDGVLSLWLNSAGANTIALNVATSNSWCYAAYPLIQTTNQWHFVCDTYDGASNRLYWDGALLGATNLAGTIYWSSGAHMYLGNNSRFDPSVGFQGRLGQVFFFNRALNTNAINWLYRNPMQ